MTSHNDLGERQAFPPPYLSDPARLDVLAATGLPDSPAEPTYDRLTRLAAKFLGSPVALVSLVDDHRQFFKSCVGLPSPWAERRETPLSHSLCQHVIASRKPFVVNDARTDPRVAGSLAITDLGVVAYLGIPMVVGGHVIGSFCAIDVKPREWTDDEIATLGDLAESVVTEIRLRSEHRETARQRTLAEQARQHLFVTLTSIGDGVITTDADGPVTFVNPVAEALCGWSESDAVGRPLWHIFRIVHGRTREPVENPVTQALSSGQTVSLANHTVLISKDGSERPIDDSAAPIRNAQGQVDGGVLVFRDVSERRRDEALKARLTKHSNLSSAVGIAFSKKEALPEMLKASTDALVQHLDAAFARIWTLDEAANVLELRASSGIYTHLDGPHGRVPVGSYKIGRIAEQRRPHLTNDVPNDPNVSDKRWAEREGMAAFAGYPLVVEERLLGVVALFSRHPLPDDTLDVLALVADVIALGIERKRAESLINSQAEALANADLRKDEFLAMLAHELRNPLGAISTGVQLVQKVQKPEMLVELSGMIAHQVGHLTRLIDDLLDVSRISQGKLTLRTEAVELAAVVARAEELVRPSVEAKRHTLTVSLPDRPVRFVADPIRTEQILGNLLTNAAKYTEPGGTIRLSAAVEGEQVVFRVRDNGVGIPAEMLPQVFGLFTQVDATMDRSQGGLGIGLTMVRSLVDIHGGRVSAASEGPGRGSEFTVHLPLVRPAAERPKPAESRPPPGPGTDRILVVDDDVETATLTARMLRFHGYEVVTAHDSGTAVEQVRRHRPGVILLDIGMPGMNGYELANRLRREEAGESARLIAVSGYAEEKSRERSREAGFLHHLTKPLDFETLLPLVKS